MTILNCQMQFVPRIKAGTKICTIRKERKRPIRAGELLSLRHWSSRPYMSPTVSILEVQCLGTCRVVIAEGVEVNGIRVPPKLLNDFAQADGFDTFGDMRAFFLSTHGGLPFAGTLIRWAPWPSTLALLETA